MNREVLPRRRWSRALTAFLLGGLVWTLIVCYPNPVVFFRNLARYRRLPIDSGLARHMKWDVPERPADIEAFVDGLLMPTSDWRLYRVPWYVPTARQAAEAMRGDCEAKTLVLASLLAGRGIPFELKASFNHIWVDYQGRAARSGESADAAYLETKKGRLTLRLPRAVDWRGFYVVEKQLLWAEMPPFRRAVWLVGVFWLALLTLGRTVRAPEGGCRSRWRPSHSGYFAYSLLASSWLFVALVSLSADRYGAPWKWTAVETAEAWAFCAVAGAFLAWLLSWHLVRRCVSVALEDDRLIAYTIRGARLRRRELLVDNIRHLQLDRTSNTVRRWRLSAVLRDGKAVALLDYQCEPEAREAWRGLGAKLDRPLLVRVEAAETTIAASEIGLSLGARLGPLPRKEPSARPKALDLVIETGEGHWTLRYPHLERGGRWMLLAFTLLPAGLFAFVSGLLVAYAEERLLWLAWVMAGAFLSMVIYLVLVLKEEMLARLGEARVEIAEGQLRFHRPDRKVESVALGSIESVELGRREATPTVAVISPERVIHIAGLCAEEEREWVRDTIEAAIIAAERAPSAEPVP